MNELHDPYERFITDGLPICVLSWYRRRLHRDLILLPTKKDCSFCSRGWVRTKKVRRVKEKCTDLAWPVHIQSSICSSSSQSTRLPGKCGKHLSFHEFMFCNALWIVDNNVFVLYHTWIKDLVPIKLLLILVSRQGERQCLPRCVTRCCYTRCSFLTMWRAKWGRGGTKRILREEVHN